MWRVLLLLLLSCAVEFDDCDHILRRSASRLENVDRSSPKNRAGFLMSKSNLKHGSSNEIIQAGSTTAEHDDIFHKVRRSMLKQMRRLVRGKTFRSEILARYINYNAGLISRRNKSSRFAPWSLKFRKIKRDAVDTDDLYLNYLLENHKGDNPEKEDSLHVEVKRGSKERRFLSNVKSSLKEHVRKGEIMWKKSRKEIIKSFEKYYRCLKNRIQTMRKQEFFIKALLAIEGEKTEMPCIVCYRPDQSEEFQVAKWQVLRHEDSVVEEVRPGKRFQMNGENTLFIESIEVGDAGQYFCVERSEYAAVYQLDVFLKDKRRVVRAKLDDLLPEVYLMGQNLCVFTMWALWGQCNTCDRQGEKTRVGQCTAKKIYQDVPVFPRDYPLMGLYPEGVPCHSTAMPRHLRSIKDIGGRESETIVSPCLEACPTEPPMRKITDETGKVVEVIEPGFHSMKDKAPVLPSLVKRQVLYEPQKSHLVLNCPTKEDATGLRWTRRDREVDPNEIKKQTKNRVWVDSSRRMHLKPLLLTDTDVYNCFFKNTRVASIKVIVVDEWNQNIKYYISYVGLAVTVVGSMVCIFCICCKKSDKSAQ